MKPNQKGNSKMNNQIKKYLYNWIIHNPQVVQSQNFNDGIKMNIDGHTELYLDPNLLLQVSVREFHHSFVSDPKNGGLKEVIDAENHKTIATQIKKLIMIQGYVWL